MHLVASFETFLMFTCMDLFRPLLFLLADILCLLGASSPSSPQFVFFQLIVLHLSLCTFPSTFPAVCIYRWRDFWRNRSSCCLSSPPLRLSQATLGGDNIDSLPVLGRREVRWDGSHTLRTRGLKYFREPEVGGSGRHEQMKSGPREALAPTWGVFPSLPLFDVVWFCVLGLVQFHNLTFGFLKLTFGAI